MEDIKSLINPEKIPSHIAIIMDGNGRWAERRSLPRVEGHKRGAEVVDSLLEASLSIGFKAVSLYTFSTENWSRPKSEIDGIWRILDSFYHRKMDKIKDSGVKVVISGISKNLPFSVRKIVRHITEKTKDNDKIILNLCLNYGGHQEIVDAVNKWLENRKPNEKITIKKMDKYLYTSGLPEVDLMIRTGGEYRISNFLLWQLAYAELIFMNILWPDFKPHHLYEAVYEFQKRERKFGGLCE